MTATLQFISFFCPSISEFKGALCDFTEYTTCCNRRTFLFTECDCSVFGSLVLLYGLCFNIKLQYIVRLGPAVKMHGFVLQMHLFVYRIQLLRVILTSAYNTVYHSKWLKTDCHISVFF